MIIPSIRGKLVLGGARVNRYCILANDDERDNTMQKMLSNLGVVELSVCIILLVAVVYAIRQVLQT